MQIKFGCQSEWTTWNKVVFIKQEPFPLLFKRLFLFIFESPLQGWKCRPFLGTQDHWAVFLACHNYCGTGHQFWMVIFLGPVRATNSLCWTFGNGVANIVEFDSFWRFRRALCPLTRPVSHNRDPFALVPTVLTTCVYRDWDSNTQPYAIETNALTHCDIDAAFEEREKTDHC